MVKPIPIDYLYGSMVKSEYQVILRNSADVAINNITSSKHRGSIFSMSHHLGCINEFEYVARELG